MMLRLVREFGMSVSFSLSAVIQLVAVNVVALVFFGERVKALQDDRHRAGDRGGGADLAGTLSAGAMMCKTRGAAG